ncbi:hypothetical protein, partial [Paracoccus nototheniae]
MADKPVTPVWRHFLVGQGGSEQSFQYGARAKVGNFNQRRWYPGKLDLSRFYSGRVLILGGPLFE